ncbi:MAG TPA: TonB-dependent receptor [Gemmatimonadaceae bacterium]|nr:TonB-dependent receptor [Gemmatimonadaceae bacterium]
MTRWWAVAAAAALWGPAGALSAQERPDSAAAGDSARAQRLAPQTITGTRLTEAGDERTPVQVDRVELRTIPRGPAAVADAVARLPGVSTFDDQGTRAQPTLDIRGFTAGPVVGVPQGVSVFLDGVRVNEGDAQQVYFDLLPTEAIQRAELIRGPTPLFGKNTLAGALLLTTARGEVTPRLEAEAEAGRFGYRAARVVASGAARGLDGYLMVRGSEEDGFRAVTPVRTRMAFATVGRRGERGDVALSALVARDRTYQAGSLPESWLAVSRDTNYTGGDYFRPELTHLALRGSRQLGGALLRGNVFARRNAYEQYNVNVEAADTRAFIRTLSGGGTVEVGAVTSVGAFPLGVTLGVEYTRNDVRYRVLNEGTADNPTVDPLECDVQPGTFPEVGVCERAEVQEDNAAAFGQAALQLHSRLTVNLAARYDYVRVPFRDLREPDNDGTSTFTRLSPRLGVNWQTTDDLRGYAAVSTGFRAPAALELACADPDAPCPLPFSLGDDPPLEPVEVLNYEAGLDWEPRENLSLDVVAFRADVRDEIFFAAATTIAGYFVNVPRTRRQGVETQARFPLPGRARALLGYAWVDGTFRSVAQLASAREDAGPAEPGDRLPLSPEHRLTAALAISRPLGPLVLDGELSGRYLSSQFLRGDDANEEEPLAGYGVADLHLGVEAPRWAVTARITNLLDRRYETFGIFGENPAGGLPGGPAPPPAPPGEAPVERFLNPGYPRSITLTVTAKF